MTKSCAWLQELVAKLETPCFPGLDVAPMGSLALAEAGCHWTHDSHTLL